jgi:hypothetical protein
VDLSLLSVGVQKAVAELRHCVWVAFNRDHVVYARSVPETARSPTVNEVELRDGEGVADAPREFARSMPLAIT